MLKKLHYIWLHFNKDSEALVLMLPGMTAYIQNGSQVNCMAGHPEQSCFKITIGKKGHYCC